MKQRLVVAAVAVAVAAVAAVPLWPSLGGGSRAQAALAPTDETKPIKCDGARDAEACAELSRLLMGLNVQLAEINQVRQSVEAHQLAIKANAYYVAAASGALSELEMEKLQVYLDRRRDHFDSLNELMQVISETSQSVVDNLR